MAIVVRCDPGAHVSTAGGIHTAIDRAEAIGGEARPDLHAEPARLAPDEPRPGELRALPERARRGGDPAASSATRSIWSTSPRPTTRSTRSRSPRSRTRSTSPARSRRTASSSTSARTWARASRPGLERAVPALEQALERCSDTTWLLLENSAGAGGTIGRSVDELAALFERLDRHPRLGICLDSCHLWVSGIDVTDPERARRLPRRGRRADRARPAPRAARERRGGAARLEPRPPREHRRGPAGREARRLPRAIRGCRACRRPRGAGQGRPRAGRGRGAQAAGAPRALDGKPPTRRSGVRLVDDAERRLAARHS